MIERIIPTKNYIILAIISVLTIVLVFYLASWYKTTKDYYKNNSVMSDILTEIKEDEISNYVIDNPHAMIYITSGKNQKHKEFEKELKKILEKYNLTNKIVYLNIDTVKQENFLYEFQKTYFIENIRNDEWKVPNIIIFEDGKAISYVNNHTNIYEIEAFLRKNEVIDD